MISDSVEQDFLTLDQMISDLSKEARKYRDSRDKYHKQVRRIMEPSGRSIGR